jgi:nicotinamidase/pyrazinamidase
MPTTRDAILIVDVQNDFCPGGALPVPRGDEVVPVLNEYIRSFTEAGAPVFASRDWHPAETRHFKAWGGPWPPHCVGGAPGAQFHPDLALAENAVIISKGMDPIDHGYSAFDGVDAQGRSLAFSLHAHGIERIYMGGLATDYCIRASVLDACARGFEVVLLLDAMRGIDVIAGDVQRALDEMEQAGAHTATLATYLAQDGAPHGSGGSE